MSERDDPTATPQPPRVPLALVVDDAEDNRKLLVELVKRVGWRTMEAADGRTAVELARQHAPDLVLLDILMPGMNGLEALERIRQEDARVPVVVVTASGDPSHGEQALELGAVNYIRRPFDPKEVEFVIQRISAALEGEVEIRPALRLVRERRTVLELENDLSLISPISSFLGRELEFHYPGWELPVMEVKLALVEALANAIEHGNLEIGFDGKTDALDSFEGLATLVDSRRAEPAYRSRTVRVEVSYEPDRVDYRVRDSGKGFNVREVQRTLTGHPVMALHGRGILLIKHYADEVSWNQAGNEIRMCFRISDPEA